MPDRMYLPQYTVMDRLYAHSFEVSLASAYILIGAATVTGKLIDWWPSAPSLVVVPFFAASLMAAFLIVGGVLILCGTLLPGDPADSSRSWMKERLGLMFGIVGAAIYASMVVFYYRGTVISLAPPLAAIVASAFQIAASEKIEKHAVTRQASRSNGD